MCQLSWEYANSLIRCVCGASEVEIEIKESSNEFPKYSFASPTFPESNGLGRLFHLIWQVVDAKLIALTEIFVMFPRKSICQVGYAISRNLNLVNPSKRQRVLIPAILIVVIFPPLPFCFFSRFYLSRPNQITVKKTDRTCCRDGDIFHNYGALTAAVCVIFQLNFLESINHL